MSSPLILRSKVTSSTWIFSFMIIIFSNQMHKVSIIFWRCLYKKEYEPKVIIIRSKLSLTVLQVKKFEHLLSKSSFSAVSSSRKKTSARTIQGVYAKSHILVLTLISEKPTFS